MIVAWLLPGLPLLIAGEFLPVPMLLIGAPLLTALAVNTLHRVPCRWPTVLPGPQRDRSWMSWWAMIGTVVVAVGFTIAQLVLNSPSVLVTRTPGAYIQTGYWIAQHGSLPITQSLSAFGGAQTGLHFASYGFVQYGHSVVPAVTAGLPLLLSAGFWTSGTGGGAAIAPVLGGLAVLSFGGLVGRLAGRQWAPAGAIVLAFTLPELYTSRDAFSETAVQVLLFGGLSFVIDALEVHREAATGPQPALAGAAKAPGGTAVLTPGGTAVFETVGHAASDSGSAAEPAKTPASGGTGESGGIGELDATPAPGETADPDRTTDPGGTKPRDQAKTADPDRTADLGGTKPADRAKTAELKSAEPATVVRPKPLAPKAAARIRRRIVAWFQAITRPGAAARAASLLTPDRMLAALGGLSLGLTTLLGPGSLVYLVPAIVVAGILVAARRAVGIPFCIGILVGTEYGIAGGYLLARPLMDSLAPDLELAGVVAGALIVAVIGALWLLRSARAARIARSTAARRPLRWLPGLAGFAVIAALAGLAVRPYLQIVRSRTSGAVANYVGALQRFDNLKVDPTRLYAEDTLYWVIWYAGIAAVLLGGFGAAVLLRRSVRAVLSWQDPSGTGLNWALPLAVLLGGSAAILWQPHTVPDQPWASRRLVPVVIPGLILFATWTAAWLTRRARERGAGQVTAAAVGLFCVGAMFLPSVSTSFGVGLTHSGSGGGLQPSAGGTAQHRVGAGQVFAVRDLCASIGRNSSVLILSPRVAQIFTQVIRGMCGVPVGWMASGSSTAEVDAVLSAIAKAGRRPVVLGATPAQVTGFGSTPMLVLNLSTTQDAHELTQPPGAPWLARYVIWMAVGNSPNVGV